jgi:hypothetical protein
VGKVIEIAKGLLTLGGLVLGTSIDASAADTRVSEALKMITDTAAEICESVPLEQTASGNTLSADAQAKLGGLVGRIANLGLSGTEQYHSERSTGVLQKDLAVALQNTNNCKLKVFQILEHDLIGLNRSNKTSTEPSLDIIFWQSIANSTNRADFEAYLRRFPEGQFAPLARNRLAAFVARPIIKTPPPIAVLVDNAPITGIKISFFKRGRFSIFEGVVPSGWGYVILVNGNKDGKWGTSATGTLPSDRSTDSEFYPEFYLEEGNSPQRLCHGYVLSEWEQNTNMPHFVSNCFFSQEGRVDVSLVPETGWKEVTYTIPDQELFSNEQTANVLVEVWKWNANADNQFYVYGTLAAPFVLTSY